MGDNKPCKSIKDLQQYFDEKLPSLATENSITALKELIENQNKFILEQNERIQNLEDRVSALEGGLEVAKKVNDELRDSLSKNETKIRKDLESKEQYSRRLCIRINGIKLSQDENGNSCLDKCKEVFQELSVNIPENCIDRAHRVGKKKKINGEDQQSMIVRFTTWRHRTEVYRACNNNDNKKYKIYLDLTKERLELLKLARSMIDNNSNVAFVLADVNCRLVAKMKDNSYSYFDNIDAFQSLL